MRLSLLIQKGGLASLATATPATLATQAGKSPTTVAVVATVTVAEPVQEMSSQDEATLREWLAYTGETNESSIDDLIDLLRSDLSARQFFLQQAEALPSRFVFPRLITCGTCIHFTRIDHPHLGHCLCGQPENIAGLWDEDKRVCDYFLPK